MKYTKLMHSEATGSCPEMVRATALCSVPDMDVSYTGAHQAWPDFLLYDPDVSARIRLRFPACWDVLPCSAQDAQDEPDPPVLSFIPEI